MTFQVSCPPNAMVCPLQLIPRALLVAQGLASMGWGLEQPPAMVRVPVHAHAT